jgi:LuxR family maltose regulon positive regulatory protein
MTNTAVSTFFLRTKLYRPSLPDDYILRPQLLAKLDDIVRQPLTLLTAPAGYGKTTLLSAWMNQSECPSVWVSLDEGDNELVVFLGYFVAAIRAIFPHFGEQLLAFTQASTRPPLPRISSYLANEIDQLEQDFVLVLDDYHVLTEPDIHMVLDDLLRHPPPRLHLVLATRHDPPLQMTKLRAQHRVTELRAKELRFSAEEIATFTERTLPTKPDAKTISILAEKTEGWPVGLRMATIAIRQWGLDEHQPAVLQVENRYIAEYLVNEVLARQPTAVRNFLLKSSILDRFCAPLCAAMMGTESLDPTILQQLEREGLFIESLDSQNQWYRYHQLFRLLLRHRLGEIVHTGEVAALHRRASVWLAANGFIEDAIDHALSGGDVKVAANILTQHSHTLMNEERWLFLESLLNKFPVAAVQEEPTLLLLLAWLNLARWRLDRVEPIRERLEEYLETASPPPEEFLFLKSSIHTFASIKNNWAANYEQALYHARTALAVTPSEWMMMRGYALIHLGTSAHFLKDSQKALAMLAEDEADNWHEPHHADTRKQIAICFVYWLSADLANLLQTSHYGLTLAEGRLFASSSFLHLFAGSACYQQNDLSTAAQHFKAALEQPYVSHPQAFVLSAISLALVYQAQKQADEAWQMAETAVQYCLEMEFPALLFTARAFQAELALQQGQLDKAMYWVSHTDVTLLPKLMPLPYQAQMVLPKILLAEDTAASRQKASVELLRLQDIVVTTHNTRYQIELLAMQAMLYQAQNKTRAADETLAQAIVLAQPGGFIRVFVDLGPKLVVLLKRLQAQGTAVAYIQQILATFPDSMTAVHLTPPQPLIEPLTEREMEVLGLLAQRLSNKEIAQELFISTETVKRHTINIYQKLGVEKRREAVAKATALGLLMRTI